MFNVTLLGLVVDHLAKEGEEEAVRVLMPLLDRAKADFAAAMAQHVPGDPHPPAGGPA